MMTEKTPGQAFWQNKKVSDFMDFLQKMAFTIGIPISIYTYVLDTQKEREEHEYFVYNSTDVHYREYEQFASRYPLLGLSDVVVGNPELQKLVKPDSLFTREEKIIAQQLILMQISLQERAFLLYSNGDSELKTKEWKGWELDLKDWVKQKQFLQVWENSRGYFDSGFENYVNSIIAEIK